jgi:hypothetical protein
LPADTRGAQSNAKRDSKPDAADASEELLKFCSKELHCRYFLQYCHAVRPSKHKKELCTPRICRRT